MLMKGNKLSTRMCVTLNGRRTVPQLEPVHRCSIRHTSQMMAGVHTAIRILENIQQCYFIARFRKKKIA